MDEEKAKENKNTSIKSNAIMERCGKFAAIMFGRVIAHKRHTITHHITTSISTNILITKKTRTTHKSSLPKLIIMDYIFVKLTFFVAHRWSVSHLATHIVRGLSSVVRCSTSSIYCHYTYYYHLYYYYYYYCCHYLLLFSVSDFIFMCALWSVLCAQHHYHQSHLSRISFDGRKENSVLLLL